MSVNKFSVYLVGNLGESENIRPTLRCSKENGSRKASVGFNVIQVNLSESRV